MIDVDEMAMKDVCPFSIDAEKAAPIWKEAN